MVLTRLPRTLGITIVLQLLELSVWERIRLSGRFWEAQAPSSMMFT